MFAPLLFLATPAFVEHPIPPSARIGQFVQINEVLCENPRYAMDFAAALAKGEAAEVAKDQVGKEASREVCGRFIGLAIPGEATVATSNGVVYELTAFRFKGDDRVGWLAEPSFAPRPNGRERPL